MRQGVTFDLPQDVRDGQGVRANDGAGAFPFEVAVHGSELTTRDPSRRVRNTPVNRASESQAVINFLSTTHEAHPNAL